MGAEQASKIADSNHKIATQIVKRMNVKNITCRNNEGL